MPHSVIRPPQSAATPRRNPARRILITVRSRSNGDPHHGTPAKAFERERYLLRLARERRVWWKQRLGDLRRALNMARFYGAHIEYAERQYAAARRDYLALMVAGPAGRLPNRAEG